MKKLAFCAAAAAVCGSLLAVESANIVGYVTETITKDSFAMIGVQFESTSSTEMTLEQLIKGDITPVTYDWDSEEAFNTANMIEVYTGNNSYDFYYYIADGWDDSLNNGEGDYFTGWCDAFGYKATVTLAPGDAIWFKARTGDVTITTPGQVYAGATEIVVPNGQFQMFAYDKPVLLDLNDATQVTYANCTAVTYDWDSEEAFNTANMIEVYAGSNAYEFYYYIADGWDDSLNNGEGDYFTGWCDGFGYKQSTKVPVARGMWAKGRQGEFTIQFK